MGKYSGSSGGDENLIINLTVSGKEAAEKEVKSFINALNTMLKGAGKYNINEYFDSLKSSIGAVKDSLRTFLLDFNNADRAADFLKSYNSYIAQFDGSITDAASHIKNEFGQDFARRVGMTFESIVSAAENAAPAIARVFDPQQLRDSFSSFTYLIKELGLDVSKLFDAAASGDSSSLRERIDELTGSLEEARWRIAELENEIERLGDSAANKKLEQFKRTAFTMAREFKSLLSANGVGAEDMPRFTSYITQIQEGTLTVRDAFAQAKKEFGYLFSTPIGNTGLEDALARIEEKVNSLSGVGGGTNVLAGLEENADTGTDAIKRETIALEEMNGKAAGLEALIEALKAIAENMKESGDSSAAAFESINRLVESIQKLGDVDETKLERIATIMSSLGGAGEIRAGTTSTDNLIRLVSSIDSIGNGSGINTLRGLASIDFTRLSALKVSKAALSNLAEYIPIISHADITPLQKLAAIDWTSLNSLRVQKSSLSGLADLLSTMNTSGANNAGMVATAMRNVANTADDIKAHMTPVDAVVNVHVEADSASIEQTISDIRDRVARAGMGTKVTISEVEMLPEAREAMARMFAYSNRPLDDNGNRIGFDPGAIEQIDALADAVASLRTNAQSLSEDIISAITFTEKSSQLAENSIRRMAANIKTALLNGEDVSSYVKAIRDALNADNEYGLTIKFDPKVFDEFIERARVIDTEASKAKEGIASLYDEVDKSESGRVIGANIEEGLSRAESGARGLSDAFASVRDKQEAVVDGMSKIESTTTPANIEASADAAKEEAAAIEGIGQATENVSEKFNTFQNILQMFAEAKTTIDSVRTAIDELVASITSLNTQLNAVDVSKLGAISGNVSAVAEGRPTESVPVEVDVESVQKALGKIGISLDELKAKIADTFNLEAAKKDAESLATSFGRVKDSLELIRDLAVATVKATKQTNDDTSGAAKLNTSTASLEKTLSSLERIKGLKFLANDEAVEQYNDQLQRLRDLLDQIREASGEDRSNLVNQFKEEAEAARNLRDTLNEVAQWNDQLSKRLGDLNAGKITGLDPNKLKLDLVPESEISKVEIYKQKWEELRQKINESFSLSGADRQKAELQINEMVAELVRLKDQIDEIASATKNAIEASDNTVVRDNTDSEQQMLKELIEQYEKLYQAKTDAAKASANGNNRAGVDAANARAAEAEQVIKGIVAENAALDEAALKHERVKKAIYNHQQALNSITAKNVAEENKEVEKLQSKLDKLNISSPKTTFGGNSESVERYTRALEDAQAKINAIQGTTGAARVAAINAANDAIASLQNLNKELNKQETVIAKHKTLWESLADGWRRFGGWSIVTRSFTKIISIMRDTVNAVKEVDAAMTELKKVTDLTQKGYNEFFTEAQTIATSVGSKLSDVVRAAGDFARLGFGIEDATALAKAATLYMNIGDGIESINEASESLISTMKAFKIEAADAMSIVDMFNEVGKELLPMPVVTRCLAECYIGQSSIALCA